MSVDEAIGIALDELLLALPPKEEAKRQEIERLAQRNLSGMLTTLH